MGLANGVSETDETDETDRTAFRWFAQERIATGFFIETVARARPGEST